MMIRQMVICITDHTDGDLHIWEHLELELKSKLKSELKLSNMFAYGRLISLQYLGGSIIFHHVQAKS